MNTKEVKWVVGLIVVGVLCCFTGCAGAPAEAPQEYLDYEGYTTDLEMPPPSYEGTLRVYTWAAYEDPGFWDAGTYAVHNLYPNVNVEFAFFEDFAAALAKMTADPTFGDVILLDSTDPKLWEGIIGPMDRDLIPLFDEMFPQLQNLESMWFDGELYFLPEEFGNGVVIYREDILDELGIPEEDRYDYNMLFKSYEGKLEDKILYYDSATESLAFAILAAGVPPEDIVDMTEEQYDMARAKFMEGKANVQGYWTGWEEGYMALTTGQAAIITGWQDTYLYAKAGPDGIRGNDDDVPVKIMRAKQGIMGWIDGWVIRKGLKDENPDLYKIAHVYINATIDREAGKYKIDVWGYGTPNKYSAAIAECQDVVEELHLDDPDKAFAGVNMWQYMGPEQTKRLSELWLELKAA